MKITYTRIIGLSILMFGYAQSNCGLFRSIADTAETAVEGAVDVAEDATAIVPAAVGVGPYGAGRRTDRPYEYERRMGRYEDDITDFQPIPDQPYDYR